MAIVSNDPVWWPTINSDLVSSYFGVAACVGLMYDWALTFGQEVELVWRQRWSLMTGLYLGVRYFGILIAAIYILYGVPTISWTDTYSSGWIMYVVWYWARALVFGMLWVIIITRLHAMYQRSRKILIFLIVTFLADNIFNGVVAVMATIHTSGEELILSGTHQCSIGSIGYAEDILLLGSISWIVSTVWEVLAMCLAVWIAVKHFRELRQHSAGEIIGDCFTVLMKTHILYFASFVAVSCFGIIFDFSPILSTDQHSMEIQIYSGFLQILTVVQSFVLGPRLILGLREYCAKLVADSDTAIGTTSIVFQERVHISTGGGV
ncbi:hypothetical protein BDR03DRAFT_1012961 [Suillus americanus]|nr:hypothetical protein BDR03DRAFT_1012961 [Suillus americanus]